MRTLVVLMLLLGAALPASARPQTTESSVIARANAVIDALVGGDYAKISVDPATFTERDVTLGRPPWQLPGTWAMPTGAGPFPAVILVHGSGPGDRDGTLGPNRMLKDLALGLATRGIAVLRYDKRTRRYPRESAAIAGLTVKDVVVDDVVAAAAFLRQTPGIDATRIVAAGHSLGAMLIPRIAEAEPRFAGFVVLAAPAQSLEQAIVRQIRSLADADGTVSAEEQVQIQGAEGLAATVAKLTAADRASTVLMGGAPPAYWLDLRGDDPPRAALLVKQPMLVLQGERDYQVTMDDFANGRPRSARDRR